VWENFLSPLTPGWRRLKMGFSSRRSQTDLLFLYPSLVTLIQPPHLTVLSFHCTQSHKMFSSDDDYSPTPPPTHKASASRRSSKASSRTWKGQCKVVKRYCQTRRYLKEQARGRRNTLFRKAFEFLEKADGRALVITKRGRRCHWWSSLLKEEEELLSLPKFVGDL